MTSQPGQQTITIHLLPMKFDPLKKYNMKNIFLKTKCGGENFPRLFSKNQI